MSMVHILYEHPGDWPAEGPLHVEAQFSGEIRVPPDLARHRANGYLAREVALFVIASEPVLILRDHPCWRLPVVLRLRGLGNVAEVGDIDVDAQTGEVQPLSEEEIQSLRKRAHDLAARLALSPEAAS